MLYSTNIQLHIFAIDQSVECKSFKLGMVVSHHFEIVSQIKTSKEMFGISNLSDTITVDPLPEKSRAPKTTLI